ncbi:hypothetical protein [Bradyrhizobium erythrophlei]|jgi:hypothetical protein|uniref:hypothetical protein n=1 Tax=Bradyrhizobium erythrophlei TaxID=1437360 RepID=UPI0009325159|nr:hypothetical protein [Bradyrhizobium erythrophlei]
MIEADRVLSTPPLNSSSIVPFPAKTNERQGETSLIAVPEAAERPSAAVVLFCKKSKREVTPSDQTLEDRERASRILKEAVTFTACVAAYDGAWKAERTGDGLFAGGSIGDSFCGRAENSLARLTRLIRKADEAAVMTAELRSLAAVAGFILDRARDEGDSDEVTLQRTRFDFLIAFAALADRALRKKYEREV